jgi:hypothetical protein
MVTATAALFAIHSPYTINNVCAALPFLLAPSPLIRVFISANLFTNNPYHSQLALSLRMPLILLSITSVAA